VNNLLSIFNLNFNLHKSLPFKGNGGTLAQCGSGSNFEHKFGQGQVRPTFFSTLGVAHWGGGLRVPLGEVAWLQRR